MVQDNESLLGPEQKSSSMVMPLVLFISNIYMLFF